MSAHASHLGLYAEETGLTGGQLGHFPQAFRHLALVGTAVNLGYQLAYGTGNVAAARFRWLVPSMLEHLRPGG